MTCLKAFSLLAPMDYTKTFDYVINKLWKIQKEIRPPKHLTRLLETYVRVKGSGLLELDMERAGFKNRKDSSRAVYCLYMTSFQSTLWRGLEKAQTGI